MLFACEYCGLIEMLAAGGLGIFGYCGTHILAWLSRRRKARHERASQTELAA